MANVTFSSPVMARDITVYAVAGDRGTILALAKEHKIPIPFDCQDGECGSCLVEIKHLSVGARYGIALTEKEKELLRQLGRISPGRDQGRGGQRHAATYRLACQCFVRNEDIIVHFEGNRRFPPGARTVNRRGRLPGRRLIRTLEEFLSYAVKVEEDAAIHFERLAEAMDACGNRDVAVLFRQLGGYSRLHLEEAKAKSVAHGVVVTLPANSAWPDHRDTGAYGVLGGDPSRSRLDALKAALQGERRGFEFYFAVAGTTTDAGIRAVAKEFVKEETEHVDTLKQWIAKEEASLRAPFEGVTS